MARTPSNMLPLGTELPDTTLPDPAGETWKLSQRMGDKGLVVMFICNHCPFVLHIAPFLETLNDRLNEIGIRCIAISSNDVKEYPADSPEKMAQFAKEYKLAFPYLYDETQRVAKSFDAACTPDFYLFDRNKRLVYRGQLDDSRPGNDIPVTGKDLLAAAELVARGEQPPEDQQRPSLGCNIKWKS
ncbi:peroxiredoxin [Marinimicrobium koreense]|uniref:Peroxiredoxin n=1 Tax=Marinimicrobium koreense TaxID=306545 RepID=A0A3N1NID3_9GAMM|nr:thioredoxin family protein [Marinimicrobium koreense]ROQ19564.1 peroxiredoxin [Marinimicrobium koreense]